MRHPSRTILSMFLALAVAILPACQAHDAAGSDDEAGFGDPGDTEVQIPFQRLADAVIERNVTGVPRSDANKLRRVFCEERSNEPVIFYHLIVSNHWHYLWLCSSDQPRRISSPFGASRLKRWLRGFTNQAVSNSAGCAGATHSIILRGNHESGIRAVATCDGQIVLTFPDSGRSVQAFTPQGGGGSYAAPVSGGGDTGTCPECPVCPTEGSGRCPECPTQRACPPQRSCPPQRECPPPPKCPACDCRDKVLTAGQEGFRQGMAKACKKVCTEIYTKCRSIDPKTAMCHMISEHCAETCGK